MIAEQNKKNNREFQTQKILSQPKNTFDHNIPEILQSFIISANTSGILLSTQILRQKLEENGHKLSKWQLLRLLHILEYYYGHGERQNILHELSANVAFRNCYL